MRSWFRRSPRSRPQAQRRPRAFRPRVEGLEERCVPAAPVISNIEVPLSVPAAKTLIVPITGTDADGDTITYSVTASNGVTVTPVGGDTYLRISVAKNGQNFGDMVFKLFEGLAPNTTAIIGGLVQSEFYDGLTFHRIEPNFVIQGGDPDGTGSGGPPKGGTPEQRQAFQFPDEFNLQAIFSGEGQLAMANSGDDTNGSQFFVTINPARHLDFNHTIFGQLVQGFEVLEQVRTQSPPVLITRAEIIDNPNSAVVILQAPATAGAFTLTVTATDSRGETSTRTFATGQVVADARPNDPAFLVGIPPDLATPADTPTTVTLTGADLENDTLTFDVVAIDNANQIDITRNGSTFTLDPKPGFTGRITLEARVHDGVNNVTTPDSQRFVLAVGDAAITAAGQSITGTETTAVNDVVVATFTSADGGAMATDFVATVNWGDGTANTAGTVVARPGGGFEVRGSHTYVEAGIYQLRVEVNSIAGGTAQLPAGTRARLTTSATIADAALTGQGVNVGGPAAQPLTNVVVATFTDAATNSIPGDFTAVINWGDGQTSAGTVAARTGGGFEVRGSHTYAAAGQFQVTTTVTDADTSALVNRSVIMVIGTAGIAAPPPPPPLGERFADRVWQDIFGAPAPAETRAAVSAFLAQGATPENIVLGILGHPATKRFQVNQLYQQLLGRPADPVGLESATRYLVGGGNLDTLRAILVSSAEYRRANGGTVQGVLRSIYQDLLGREIDLLGERDWTLEIQSGDTMFEVTQRIMQSPEYQFRAAQTFYQRFLGRAAEPAGAAWVIQLRALGVSDDQIAAILMGSPENFGRL